MVYVPSATYNRSPALLYFLSKINEKKADPLCDIHSMSDLYRAMKTLTHGSDMRLFVDGYTHWFIRHGHKPSDAAMIARANVGCFFSFGDSTVGWWRRLKWWFFAGVSKSIECYP